MPADSFTSRIALSMLPGMDAHVASKLIEVFGTPSEVLNATETELKCIQGIPAGVVSAQKRYQALKKAEEEAEFISAKGVNAFWFDDAGYPRRLLNADNAPAMIYTAGDTDLNNYHFVGIVGTRHATAYGTAFTEQLVTELAQKVDGIVTVSGLAYGIDIAAHRASIAAGIPTIGVVAHGLSTLFPAVHRDTASRMIRNGGMVLTDYTHDVKGALRPFFLARNRLIAALSNALIVVESAEHGGALSTATHAVKSGTPVFAVPGRVTDNYSVGCNKLLTNGTATCITCADDLIKAMGWETKKESNRSAESTVDIASTLNAEEKLLIHKILTVDGCDNDTLTSLTGIAPAKVMTLMIGLEMRGIVALEPGNRYRVIQTIDHSSLL